MSKKGNEIIQEEKPKTEVLMFLSFLSMLFQSKKATISSESNKVFLLNSEASNYFLCGRDENLMSFIGIEESMLPWFPEVPWTEVALSYRNGYVYLIATEDDGNIILGMGLKIRRKRMLALSDPIHNKSDNTINFKVFKIFENSEIAISNRNLKNNIKVTVINNIDDIMEREINDDPFSFEEDGFVSDFTKIKIK